LLGRPPRWTVPVRVHLSPSTAAAGAGT